MRKVDISVIVPTFMEEKYIENCLKSLRNQDFKGTYEIIVCDANSTDKTRAIAKKYSDKVINCKKRGIGFARNLAAKYAKGKILLFLDADTISYPWLLRYTHTSLNHLNFTGTSGFAIPYDGRAIDKLFYYLFHVPIIFLTKIGFPIIGGWFAAYRKKEFLSIDGFKENIGFGEDVEFSLRVRKVGKCFFMPKRSVKCSTRRSMKEGPFKIIFFYIFNSLRAILSSNPLPVENFPHTEEDRKIKLTIFNLHQK